MKARRPTTGAFARIGTSEAKRSQSWKQRDLSDRPQRRGGSQGRPRDNQTDTDRGR
jgi:hypothetical protein